MNVGDRVEVHTRPAEVIRVERTKIRVEFDSGRTTWDYRARHELPATCRECDAAATHRVEINAPGNGDCFGACAECADARKGRYVTVHEDADR